MRGPVILVRSPVILKHHNSISRLVPALLFPALVFLALALLALVPLTGCVQDYSREPPLPANPTRIVSMNPCVDAILKEVADPAQIAAISHYSHDPRATSVDLAWARRFPSVAGNAEDVLAAKPDLVLSGPHVELHTHAALRRLGVPLVRLAVPESVAQSREQILTLAKTVGHAERATVLIAKIDAAVQRATAFEGPPRNALIWQGGGLVPGEGTLADELLQTAGYRNVSKQYGLKKWDILPLEMLLAAPNAEIFLPTSDNRQDRLVSHPVLRAAAQRIRLSDYPRHLLYCGGPTMIAALDRLARARREPPPR